MIKLKLSTMENETQHEIEIVDGETLDSAVTRILEPVPLDREPSKIFQVLLNGQRIEPGLWPVTKLSPTDRVLIAPLLEGDDGASIFKQIAIIAITAAASVYLTPAAGATFASAMAVGAVTIGASLLLNALIPPPNTSSGGGLSGDTGLDTSQMYSVNGQSNATRKFDTVPKVYGTHRMFPVVAANPYVELETDAATGELAQYLYCVYDFGLGPLFVEDLYIGDSPLTSFSDYQVRFVDFNKPAVSEGAWDDDTFNSLALYKGDTNVDTSAVAINGNYVDGGVESLYRVKRNSAPNIDNDPQEVILTFYCPNGLYSYSSGGVLGKAYITLDIRVKFLETGITIPFNDLPGIKPGGSIESWSVIGGDPQYENSHDIPLTRTIEPFLETTGATSGWLAGSPSSAATDFGALPPGGDPHLEYTGARRYKYFGIKKGTTEFIINWGYYTIGPIPGFPSGITTYMGPGHGLYEKGTGTFIGRIIDTDPVPDGVGGFISGIVKVYLNAPTEKDFTFYVVEEAQVVWKYSGGATVETTPKSRKLDYILGPVAWMEIVEGRVRLIRSSTSPVYATVRFTPVTTEDFEITVTRIETSFEYTSQTQSNLSLIETKTRFDRQPIVTDKRHKFLEMRIKATNQLNGTISNLSGVCSSPLMVYDGETETWSRQLTRNPAWVFTDLLIGEINKRAIDVSKLHLPSILEWAEFCDEVPTPPTGEFYTFPRFECNFILDFTTTLQQLVQQVAGSAQASLSIIDGKYGVLIDQFRDVPVQIFTPRNSRDFSSTRSYIKPPDGLKIKFVNPELNWNVFETIVYDDGFNEENALEFDELTTFAVTNVEQAWRFGRYMMAQSRLRQETMTITVDFEHLVCTRGDFVQITQDVMKVGGTPCRVRSKVGSVIKLDDGITFAGVGLGYVIRTVSGIHQGTLEVIDSTTVELDGELPGVGDLIIIGETESVVFDCIVKSISPNADLSATLTLVEKADAVYQAESLDEFPPYNPQISGTVDSFNTAPPEVVDLLVTDNFWQCSNGEYEYYVELDWDAPVGSSYELFEIYVDSGLGYDVVGTTRRSIYKYIVNSARVGIEHKFKVLAVSATGHKLNVGEVGYVTATPVLKTTPPSDVDMLSIDITGEVLQLSWGMIDDCDVREYMVRYSPVADGTWLSSTILARAGAKNTSVSVQARSGVYLVKAIDFAGNESEHAAVAITTIPNLFGLNVISEVSDFPALLGGFDKTENFDGSLVLKQEIPGTPDVAEFFEEGFYYYDNLLDLGDIFSVRLQSLIDAEGYTLSDIMGEWVPLSEVEGMAGSGSAEWDVEAQYRATNDLIVLSDWPDLSSIEQLSVGNTSNFTPWRKFTMGDATGRIFQFRLRLLSYLPSVSPRVFDGIIRADMPDRIDAYNNMMATAESGYTLVYNPAFKGPSPSPNVQISIDGAESGDYWTFDSKTETGFTVRFFDKNDEPVARQFDAQVKGFGRKSTNSI